MKAALIQNEPERGQVARNVYGLTRLMRDAKEASIAASGEAPAFYVLPELCLSGYCFERPEAIRPFAQLPARAGSGSSLSLGLDQLIDYARRETCAIIAGFAEIGAENGAEVVAAVDSDGDTRAKADKGVKVDVARAEPPLYNSAAFITPDGIGAVYRKTHLFGREKKVFAPGDSGFLVVEWRGVRLGLAICYDWMFPESFRTLALMGAEVVTHCANLVMPYCQRAAYARAVENRVYVLTANRVGAESYSDQTLLFTGESVALSPTGEYLACLERRGEAFALVDIDPELSRNKRINPDNDLFADRRPDIYAL